jgi:hypothetical protein
MGIEDIVNKAKDALGGADADATVDQVADAVKEKTPDAADGAVDTAAQAVKDHI